MIACYWEATTLSHSLDHIWLISVETSYHGFGMVNTLRPRQNGCHFPDDIFKCIFLNESIWISFEISLKYVPKGPINNIPALVQIMAWRRPGDKPLSEPMLVCFLTHICVTRPQWVNMLAIICVFHRSSNGISFGCNTRKYGAWCLEWHVDARSYCYTGLGW